MTEKIERIPCKTSGCEYTILPSTSKETGGFCMPCFQKWKRQEKASEKRMGFRIVQDDHGISDRDNLNAIAAILNSAGVISIGDVTIHPKGGYNILFRYDSEDEFDTLLALLTKFGFRGAI